MSIAEPNAAEIVPLDWDTRQFGFTVARLRAFGLPTRQLERLIAEAQHQGIEMLVVVVEPQQPLPDELLARFGGILADDKVTFLRGLEHVAPSNATRGAAGQPVANDVIVEPFGGDVASAQLIELAIAAGEYSRFHLDPRFPQREFETLYRLWIERSIRHELADTVLVARAVGDQGTLLGMVTVAVADAVGSIGLIAVDKSSRGRGIAARLINAAHAAMRDRGAQSALVVTQATNQPACRLYQCAGYSLAMTERIYHFWPQATA